MKYLMKAGVLYEWGDDGPGKVLSRLQSRLYGDKTVLSAGGEPLLQLTVGRGDPGKGEEGRRTYRLCDPEGRLALSGRPQYAKGEDPVAAGWPVFRAPRVDRAAVCWEGEEFCLTMQNSQNYRMTGADGGTVLQVMHRGLVGGWMIEAQREFPDAVLCGLFAFCRLVEMENEFAPD